MCRQSMFATIQPSHLPCSADKSASMAEKSMAEKSMAEKSMAFTPVPAAPLLLLALACGVALYGGSVMTASTFGSVGSTSRQSP